MLGNFSIRPRAWSPRDLPNLLLWLEADRGVTTTTTAYAGAGTIAQDGTAITGLSTAFMTEVVVGDKLIGGIADAINATVTVITDDTNITVDTNATVGAGTFTVNPQAGTPRITTWVDQSDGGRNFIQATAINRPWLKASAANGFPSIAYAQGGNHLLSNGTAAPLLGNLSAYTLVAVMKGSSGTNRIYAEIAATPLVILYHISADQESRFNHKDDGSDELAAAAFDITGATNGTFHVRGARRNTGDWSQRCSATTGTTSSASIGTTTTTSIRIGGGATEGIVTGEVIAVAAYSDHKSDKDYEDLFQYFKTKYAI